MIAVMAPPMTVAGMLVEDVSVRAWLDGSYVVQLYRWPVTTAAGRLAIALAWPMLFQHHGAILGEQRKLRASVIV